MKISESTIYPHPVLTPWSDDVAGQPMSCTVQVQITSDGRRIVLSCRAKLDHPDILSFLGDRKASYGIYVRCQETGLRELTALDFPEGSHEFAPGGLLGRVYVRPMIWTRESIHDYLPSGAHPEYSTPMDVAAGRFLALDYEHAFDVAHPALPPIESIFEIRESQDVLEGEFDINTDADKIAINMAPKTFELVQKLRETDDGARAALMNSLYAPTIMDVLQKLKESPDNFEGFRWIHPFRARCESVGVNAESPSLLNDAQKLLGMPFSTLSTMLPPE